MSDPKLGGLTFAEGTVPTVKGDITTRWEKSSDNQFTLAVHVPANTRASIYIPKLSKKNFTITESRKVLWPEDKGPVSGVATVETEDTFVKCLVGAGDYKFRAAP